MERRYTLGRKKEIKNPLIGERIKDIRKQAQLTQAQFGKIFFVTEQTVRNWESGRRKIDLEMVRKICDYFNSDMSYVLGMTDLIETVIDSDIENLLSNDKIFISYLESIGISVDVFPCSGSEGIDIDNNKISPKFSYRYEITGNNEPRVFNEKEWTELQIRIAEMIKLLIN